EAVEVQMEDSKEKLLLPCGKFSTRRCVSDHISGRTRSGATGGCRFCQGKVVKPSSADAAILGAMEAQISDLRTMMQRLQDTVKALNSRMDGVTNTRLLVAHLALQQPWPAHLGMLEPLLA
ncbi:hypothetical protein DFQ27_000464, partial [Actinomortierella ambigua]